MSAEDYSTLYGIVSYGSDCCENCGKSLGVYTKVENYVNWIKTNMRDWNKRKYLWVHTTFLTVISNFRETHLIQELTKESIWRNLYRPAHPNLEFG